MVPKFQEQKISEPSSLFPFIITVAVEQKTIVTARLTIIGEDIMKWNFFWWNCLFLVDSCWHDQTWC